MDPFVFVARRPVPELGIQVGEVVVVEPGAQRPVTVERALPPNYGLLLLASEAGDLECITPAYHPDVLRAAVGLDQPSASASGPRRRARRASHLRRLK